MCGPGGWRTISPFGDALSFYSKYLQCDYTGSGYRPLYEMNVYWIDGNGTKHRYMQKDYGTNTWTDWIPPYCHYPLPPSFDNRTLPTLASDGSTLWTGTHMSSGYDPVQD